MKKGFPRPMTFVGTTSRSPYAKHKNGSYGRKWNDRKYPHPYTASDSNPASIHTGRLHNSVRFKECGVCGETVKDEMVGLILYNMNSRVGKYHYTDWVHSESGPYHLMCLNMAFKSCPHLAETSIFMPGYGEWKVVRPLLMAENSLVDSA